jgi:hypothetical protein
LTDAELLLLLEGDVSDVDLDMSDDELDLASDINRCLFPTKPMVPGLDPEMIEGQVWEEDDLDDVPLSLRLPVSRGGDAEVEAMPAISHSSPRRNLRWRMKDMEEVDAVCNTSCSVPKDDEITPFE